MKTLAQDTNGRYHCYSSSQEVRSKIIIYSILKRELFVKKD